MRSEEEKAKDCAPVNIAALKIEATYDDERYFVEYRWNNDAKEMQWSITGNCSGSSELDHHTRLIVLAEVRARISRGQISN